MKAARRQKLQSAKTRRCVRYRQPLGKRLFDFHQIDSLVFDAFDRFSLPESCRNIRQLMVHSNHPPGRMLTRISAEPMTQFRDDPAAALGLCFAGRLDTLLMSPPTRPPTGPFG